MFRSCNFFSNTHANADINRVPGPQWSGYTWRLIGPQHGPTPNIVQQAVDTIVVQIHPRDNPGSVVDDPSGCPGTDPLVPRIVADEQLSQSKSALATVTLGLDMIFDALGGIFIAVFGATTLFLLDSLTFAVTGLLFFRMIPATEGGGEGSEESAIAEYVADLRTGIDILRGTVFVDVMFTSAVFNFAVGVILAILPAFGELLGGAAIYGLLLGALGIGRLLGSASASYLNDVAYGRLKTVSYLISVLLLLGSVYSPSLVLTVRLFGLAWISAGITA